MQFQQDTVGKRKKPFFLKKTTSLCSVQTLTGVAHYREVNAREMYAKVQKMLELGGDLTEMGKEKLYQGDPCDEVPAKVI